MEIPQLEYIIRLAENEALVKTAGELFISPSALSQYISKLEDRLGTKLFKRTKGAWPLTQAGTIYVEAARELLWRYRQMQKDIRDVINFEKGAIHVGISSGKASKMFSSVFPKFNKKYPNISIKLTDGHTKYLVEQAEKGQFDLVFSTAGVETSGLVFRLLLRERFVLAIPKTHPLASRAAQTAQGKFAAINLDQFRNDYFMLAHPDTTLRIITDKIFAKAGFKPRILCESSSTTTLYDLVETGYGLSLIPMGYINPNSASVYFLTNPAGEWDNIVIYPKGTHLSKAEEYFISLAEDYFVTRYSYMNN